MNQNAPTQPDDASKPEPAKPRRSWFAIRKELSPGQRRLLVACSFLVPIGLWCLVSYVPWIWHPDMELQTGVKIETGEAVTVFQAGDKVSLDYYGRIRGLLQEKNDDARTQWAAAEDDRDEGPLGHGAGARINPALQSGALANMREARARRERETAQRRENRMVLRQMSAIAEANGWVEPLPQDPTQAEFDAYDAAIYEVWKELATGEAESEAIVLGEDNLDIIRANWGQLARMSETFNARELPTQPLLRLLPEGRRVNPEYVPTPGEVLTTGFSMFVSDPGSGKPWMHERMIASIKIVFLGFFYAALIGVPLGVLAGTYDFFSKLFEPFVDFFRYMPAPVFATLLVVIFGAQNAPKIALVFLGTFFQLVLVVANTTRLLDQSLIEAARTLGAKGKGLLVHVILPGILPKLYGDLRILLGWAWTWLVIAELIGVKSGLTEVIDTQGTYRNFDRVYPVIILIGLVGFFTDQTLQALARRLFPYEFDRRPGWWTKLKEMLASARLKPAPVAAPSVAISEPKGVVDVRSA